jgi:hypothetical protein
MEVSEGGTVTVNATSAVAAFSPHYSEAGTVEKYKGPNGTVGAVAVDSHGATHINPKNVYQKRKCPTVTDMAGGLFLLHANELELPCMLQETSPLRRPPAA